MHGFGNDTRVLLQHFRSGFRSRECNDVLTGQVFKEVANSAADQLDRTLRQHAGFDDASHHQFRQVGSAGCWLDDCRHAGKQRRCQFLQHSPAWKVICVDVHRGTGPWSEYVLANKRAVTRQDFRRTVEKNFVIRHFATSFSGINEKR